MKPMLKASLALLLIVPVTACVSSKRAQIPPEKLPTEQNASCRVSFQNKKVDRLSWTGECMNGFTEGNGELRAINQYGLWTYNGQMKSGRPDGYGKFVDESGGYYEGNFKNGQYHGKGKYVLSNGDTYTGEFFNGKRHGEGIFRAGGERNKEQSGRWESDVLGVYIKDEKSNCSVANPNPIPNEAITYSGGCKDGLAEGTGKLVWLIDGKPNPNDGRYEGKFIKGRFIQGKIFYENGDFYEGTLTNGKRDGLTKFEISEEERRRAARATEQQRTNSIYESSAYKSCMDTISRMVQDAYHNQCKGSWGSKCSYDLDMWENAERAKCYQRAQ